MEHPIQSQKSTHLNFWANFLLALGALGLILSFYLIYQRYNPQKLAFKIDRYDSVNSKTAESEIIEPIGIKMNSVDISLPVIPSQIISNKWEATTKGVSYLQTSAIPGEKGNSILYGHNWSNLLGNLKRVKPGDEIVIIFSDNSSKLFYVEFITEVSPNETSILNSSSDERITVYTCSGFLDNKRLVVVAKLLV